MRIALIQKILDSHNCFAVCLPNVAIYCEGHDPHKLDRKLLQRPSYRCFNQSVELSDVQTSDCIVLLGVISILLHKLDTMLHSLHCVHASRVRYFHPICCNSATK
jgi:hypothetical protein